MTDFRRFRTDLVARGILASPVSVRDVLRRLRMVEREITPLVLDTITADDAREYVTAGRMRGWTVSQYNNRARALNTWIKWRDDARDSPIVLLPEVFDEFRSLTDDQYERMRSAIPGMAPFHAVTCAFAFGVGIRPEEVCRLDIEDVDLHGRTLFIRKPAKKGKRRRIPIPDWVCDQITRWLTDRPKLGPGNPDWRSLLLITHRGNTRRAHPGSLGRVVRLEARALGFRANFQIARHTVATLLLKGNPDKGEPGLDIRYVQYYLGHVNIKNTARYAEVRFEDVERRYRATTLGKSTEEHA